ncbi:pyruvate dehydrogenase complex dihydrolipoyllysine-residue acetyltransferase [Aliiglaciecola sp. CAU 1673]|uniref:pyruvate dehydrogenase complex dihydrolipoyllysine-residue acetyltransferase n=1 Tax=Aliiglaciecola sp. CAU 1673 TaxID=3032595 RepID=UPI0023DBDF7B|nr:pyruvate dehydrogenase complex dihydrolipoyllysine-residue acetyltransferase [Aliiglaciecola sp. CAU 1673]MDF2178410.1 pyruvate dehydrogenase complex dihydrolipoyllysine-residue acetyltransferase [Aliiglaciecola sp. CAU 1673]
MSQLKDVLVPDVGGEEVEIIEICVAVGDKVEAEESLITVESDKASMDIPAPFAGVVKEILVQVGDKIGQDKLIMKLESAEVAEEDAKSEDKVSKSEEKAEKPAPKEEKPAKEETSKTETKAAEVGKVQEVQVPDIGDAADVDVIEVLVKVGDKVEAETGLITLETDKATMDVPAPFAGVVKELKVKTGDKVSQGSLIALIETLGAEGGTQAEATPAKEAHEEKTEAPQANAATASAPKAPPVPHHPSAGELPRTGKIHASPSVRRLAREFGVDLAQVKGSGPKNRVLKEDVQSYVKYELSRPKMTAGSSVASGSGGLQVLAPPKVDFAKFGEVEEVPLTRIQKISGPNLHRNWVTIPHVTQFEEADITEVENFRKEQNAIAEKKKLGVKITPLVFIMKAVADALKAHPVFNSSLSESGESLIQKKYYHIGIAVDTPGGLVVPVVRDVDKKGIYELSEELAEISKKAREGKLKAADMQGSCFTISSLGGIGGTAFTPIVNAPDVAILGVSRSDIKPKWNGKEFEPRLMLPLSLSYDHRVIDGAVAARFAVHLSSVLGDIRQMLL